MATMLNGAAVMDAALLVIAGLKRRRAAGSGQASFGDQIATLGFACFCWDWLRSLQEMRPAHSLRLLSTLQLWPLGCSMICLQASWHCHVFPRLFDLGAPQALETQPLSVVPMQTSSMHIRVD